MIQQLIASIVSELAVEGITPVVAPTFVHGWAGWNNLAVDEIQNTVVILLEPVVSEDSLKGNFIEEKYPLEIAFLEKSELEESPSDELVHTDRMRRLRAKFIYKAAQSPLFRYVDNIKSYDNFKVKDVCLSGVGLQIRLTPMEGVTGC